MIRIHKPARAPKVLGTKGLRARRALVSAYSRDPRGYADGTNSLDFNSTIYGHASVKKALRTAQHDKCAFCESKFAHISYGDVEHFRPKGGWRQKEGGALQQPGYYWLAYDWANLFVSCTLCNQRFKKNLFPLRTPTRRARSHAEDVSTEDSVLLDPGVDDPEAFISFRQEVPFAVNGNARGRETIRILGLTRDELAEQRRERLEYVKTLQDIVRLGNRAEATKARDLLQRMQQDSSAYASMTRAFITQPSPRSNTRPRGQSPTASKPGRARQRARRPSSAPRRSLPP